MLIFALYTSKTQFVRFKTIEHINDDNDKHEI